MLTAVVFLALHPRAGAAPLNDRDVAAGKALFARQCVTCHGPGGRGDGPSATGFATKPSDLADGRVMNPLPDEFLVNVIRRGGGLWESVTPTTSRSVSRTAGVSGNNELM